MAVQNVLHPFARNLLTRSSFTRSGFGLLLGGLGCLLLPAAAPAQVNNADLACYLHGTDGVEYDLSALCTEFEQPPADDGIVLQTGDVQVTLRWNTTDDLDLHVTDPFGDRVYYGNQQVASGGQLDVDANAGCGTGMASPVENIFWPTGGGAPGDYIVRVDLFSRCGAAGPIAFTLDVNMQGQIQSFSGSVDDGQTSVEFPFTYTAAGTPAATATAPPMEGMSLPGVPGQ
ncbi:MAG: hypothetical protein AAFR58_04005 [Cyanobacteria bacterium J06627_28]